MVAFFLFNSLFTSPTHTQYLLLANIIKFGQKLIIIIVIVFITIIIKSLLRLNSSLDIAFSLNCEQPASLADSPSRSTYENPLHIRITTPTNRTPVVLHKELSDGQPCLSPARKNPPPTHSSKDLASSLNHYFDDGMVLSSTRREECSDSHVSRTAEQTQGEAMTQSGGCSAGKDSSASELSGEDNLINELFFIQ